MDYIVYDNNVDLKSQICQSATVFLLCWFSYVCVYLTHLSSLPLPVRLLYFQVEVLALDVHAGQHLYYWILLLIDFVS